MTNIKIFVDKLRLVNDRFWAACGSDELYPMAYSDEGEFLMARMEKTGSCRYVRNHYALNFEIQSGIRCGGDVYTEDENGNPVYDFTWINGVYRNFVKHGIKPIVELDFLPDKLTGSGGNVTQEGTEEEYTNRFYPNDWNKWSGLLKTFVRNLADEFGIEEIRTWYFEVWNEPDSWPIESWDMFYKLYDVFVDAVTSVAAMMTTRRILRASMPMVCASSSPMVRMLIFQRSANSTMRPMAMGMTTTASVMSSFAPVRLPMSQ